MPKPGVPAHTAAAQIAKAVTEQSHQKREELKDAYGLTTKQVERDEKRAEQAVKEQVERAYTSTTSPTSIWEAELQTRPPRPRLRPSKLSGPSSTRPSRRHPRHRERDDWTRSCPR